MLRPGDAAHSAQAADCRQPRSSEAPDRAEQALPPAAWALQEPLGLGPQSRAASLWKERSGLQGTNPALGLGGKQPGEEVCVQPWTSLD